MAKKEQEKEQFVVSDRRKFTSEGELRPDAAKEESDTPQPPAQLDTEASPLKETPGAAVDGSSSPTSPATDQPVEAGEGEIPTPPSAAEQSQQQSDYQDAGKKIDSMLDAAGAQRPPDMEITFERLIGSLYMQAMMQLGMMREENAPQQPDLISARQTIDTISLLSGKTKGNLTDREANLLQNCLFELRMAFLEITNVLTKPPSQGAPVGTAKPKK